ncbi:MAG: SulP family inorganic anion transporter [Gammaproteobacteria bacterium]|nr:SulP family inorganic anion transporter [Gammaproteobacteria bacterium]
MYSRADFGSNVAANITGGITAGVIALPLALAFGIASGAGAAAGLYGAIVVGFFAAVFGGTPSQISGPTGPMTVIMTAMVVQFSAAYPDQGLAMAFTTVSLAGLLQILMGRLQLGRYIIMVPYPVISGFMSGIGVIIILLQIGPLLGHDAPDKVLAAVVALPAQVATLNLPAFAIGVLTLLIVFLWRGRVKKVLPAPLVALVVGSLAAAVFLPDASIPRIGEVSVGLPSLHLPAFDIDAVQAMLGGAITLAVLGSIDSLLTSLVADNMTGTQHDSDRELVGQGVGNFIAGLVGGLPGAGATMRTMVNIRAGGTGPLSGATHAIVLLAFAGGLGFLIESIPLAVLAGILIKVGYDILDLPFLTRLHRLPRFPAALMTLVMLLTVFVDLITAVAVGVFIKNVVTLDKLSDLQLGNLVLSDGVTDVEGLHRTEKRVLSAYQGSALLLRVTGPVSYGVGRGLVRRMRQFSEFKVLIVDLKDAALIGISTSLLVENLIDKAMSDGAEVKLIGLQGHAGTELAQLGIVDRVGSANCFNRLKDLPAADGVA